jgi:hypothetical protein
MVVLPGRLARERARTSQGVDLLARLLADKTAVGGDVEDMLARDELRDTFAGLSASRIPINQMGEVFLRQGGHT